MPSYGPWLTPPVQSHTSFATANRVRLGNQTTTLTFAAVCELAGGATVLSDLANFQAGPGDGGWRVGQVIGWADLGALITALPDYSPTLPPHAVSVDYDPAGVDRNAWPTTDPIAANYSLTSTSSSGTATTTAGVTVRTADPTTPAAGTGLPDISNWIPGATLAALPTHGSATVPAGGTFTLLASFPWSRITTTGVDGYNSRYLIYDIHYDAQVTHTDPSGFTTFTTVFLGPVLTFTYQPRRYRFVYSTLPRLRQFPRDDALGGSPRQGKTNGPTSVQGSARQGWRGAYR